MLKHDKKAQINSNAHESNAKQSMSQVQIQQHYAQAQAMLMLTQLNSAYYKIHLTLIKTLNNIENKYFSRKMTAFLALSMFKGHVYQIQSKIRLEKCNETEQCQPILNQLASGNDASSLQKHKNKHLILPIQSIHQTKSKVIVQARNKFNKMFKIISNKLFNTMCCSFYHLIRNGNQNSTLKILSDKSSKIQTIDSQKSKVFKRSIEKRVSRKSFSMQKSITNDKNKYYVPIKYQAQNKISTPPSLSNQTSSIQQQKIEEGSMTDFAKFLQKNVDPLLKDRRNLLSANRQRKVLKSTSNKKYNVSALVSGKAKQQKIRQLQYLQRKYKKLISEFNWFSERFLKVIQEETV